MSDYGARMGALFSQGFSTGAAIADRKRGRALEERRLADEEMRTRMDQERMARVAQEFDMEQAVKRASIGRFVEASKGMDEFSKGASQIDWGASDAPAQYEALTRQYLPSILKHEDVAKRWEIYNKTAMGNSRFTSAKLAEIATAKALAEAAQIAPELALDPPKKADGSIDAEAFGERLKGRREEMNAEAEKLRAISANRGGPRAQRAGGLSAADKAEMAILQRNIEELDKSLNSADPRGNIRNPQTFGYSDGSSSTIDSKNSAAFDRQLSAINQLKQRRKSLMNQLRALGAKESVQSEPVSEPFQSDGPAMESTSDGVQPQTSSSPPDFIFDIKTGRILPYSTPK